MRKVAVVLLLAGCGNHAGDAGPRCNEGEIVYDGDQCAPKLDECAGAQRAIVGGGCAPVGVPPSECGEGFTPDGNGGCNAVLPEARCPDGQLAIPGETKCREVAPCGEGTWGSIPTAGSVAYVDGAYTGGSSDGSRERPYVTIMDAVAVAPPDQTIAIAAGTYPEAVHLRRPLKLWGRCPSMVTIEGTSSDTLATAVTIDSGGELHDLAIRGLQTGVAVLYTGATTTLDRVWIHDTGERGIRCEGSKSSRNSLVVTRSLFEHNAVGGIMTYGCKVDVSASVFRDEVSHPTYGFGAGIILSRDDKKEIASDLTIEKSVIERATTGIANVASHAVVKTTVIRDIVADVDGGPAIAAIPEAKVPLRPTVDLDQVVLERTDGASITLRAATLAMKRCTVRDSFSTKKAGEVGTGVELVLDSDGTIEDTAITRSHNTGILLYGSKATMKGLYVADGLGVDKTGQAGLGVWITPDSTGRRSEGSLVESLIVRARVAGLLVAGCDFSMNDSEIRETLAQKSSATFGDGAGISPAGDPGAPEFREGRLSVSRSVVRKNARAGINVAGGSLTLASSLLTCNPFDFEVDRRYGGGLDPDRVYDFALEDGGGNVCGCGVALTACKAQQNNLESIPIEAR